MSNVLYVSPPGKHWQDRKKGVRFDSKKEAINHAKKMTKEALEGNIDEIRWQCVDGNFQAELTFSSDPYPPIVRTF